ncbi:hypothetical protein V7S43_004071 [Phytophthora oleae]|uniref:Uncharacterized protein n=1 Tax=Phytophthora oleae TaxID=2107226 RepID=A0ABD3FZ26_9STRA
MVKPWLKKDAADASVSTTTRIGFRALSSTSFGANLLASLRQRIVRRPKPAAITTQATDEAPVVAAAVQPSSVFTVGAKQPTAPKPPPTFDGEGSDDSEGEDPVGQEREGTARKIPKKKKRLSLGINRWVPKLLDPVEKHRDRVHRKKKYVFSAHRRPPAIFTDSRPPSVIFLSRILEFLHPFEPARVTAYVNKSTAAGVKAFYDLYYPPPRPRRYLVHRLLENRQSVFIAKVMELLSIEDRISASASCWSFYDACNTLPLEFNGVRPVQKFLECYEFPRTSRVHKRFKKTPALLFNGAKAEDLVKITQLLERGSDSEDDLDDSDCFTAVQELSLRKIKGLSALKGKYFEQLLQTLFMGHVSSRLHSLELIDLQLEDAQLKQLARLWRDARFPVLRRLSLANNPFSSRYMRDWVWSFENERFLNLQALDVSHAEMTNQDLQRFIACLSTTPSLQNLTLSNNLCSFPAIQKLREQIQSRALKRLRELHCVAITTDEVAMGYLLEIFQILPPYCPLLQVLNLSGNPLSNPKAAAQLARVFHTNKQLSGWPELMKLSTSSTKTNCSSQCQIRSNIWDMFALGMNLGDDGTRTIATALLQGQPTQIQYLDLSGNCIRSSIDTFVRVLAAKKLPCLRSLAIADNELGSLEFETLSSTLATNCCPRLQILDLSGRRLLYCFFYLNILHITANFARGEGIARFCPFLLSPPARKLWALNLSNNEIPHRGLLRLNETLARGNCKQLHELNLSCNSELKAIASFFDLIRGKGLPSLTILQVGYALSRSEGYELVRDTLRRRSVQELRRLKQLRFEEKLIAIQDENDAKAERDQMRCRRQTQRLREVYDHLENEADRALRRRKQVKKASQLHIHQEIARQKQQRAHARLCRQLDSDVHAA